MAELRISEKLKQLIERELSEAAFYKMLAKTSPNTFLMQLMLELSNDEAEHADQCINILRTTQGARYVPKTITETGCSPDFTANLRLQIDREIEQYRKYSYEYINSSFVPLKNFYFKTQTDELTHALKLLLIIKTQ